MITTEDHQSYHNLGEYVEPRVIIWNGRLSPGFS